MRQEMRNAMQIGLPLAALILAVAMTADGQAGLWRSTSTGVTTSGTVTTSNTGAGSINAAGGAVIGSLILSSPDSFGQNFLARGRASDNESNIVFTNNAISTIYGTIKGSASGLTFTAAGSGSGGVNFASRLNTSTAQPGFLAYMSTDTNNVGTSLFTGIFDVEVYDTASSFSGGVFEV